MNQFEQERNSLVKELVSSRQLLFQMIIDQCLEAGKLQEARGWKWLMEHHKYPSRRGGKHRGKWGWSLNTISIDGKSSIYYAEEAGPTILPWYIIGGYKVEEDDDIEDGEDNVYGGMSSTPVRTPEEALLNAAQAMGRLLDHYYPEDKPNKPKEDEKT